MVLDFPAGIYLFMGDRYYHDLQTFAVGTPTGIFIYWVGVFGFNLAGRWVIRQFPEQRQAGQRLAVMVLILEVVMLIMAVFDLWVFSIIPGSGVVFSVERLKLIVLFGCAFVFFLCLAIGLVHIYSQWQERQTEIEQLKHHALQQQYDALKWQVNPHFLFNSLNAISALIGEDRALAERFVDNLAKVYRYLLKTGNQPLVPLADELNFIQTYAELLQTRYGESIQITLPPLTCSIQGCLPPISLQTLIDNAMKHNLMTTNRPLFIQLSLIGETSIRVTNTLQPKKKTLNIYPHNLANLRAKYRQWPVQPVEVEMDDKWFTVTLPLLSVTTEDKSH
ncbi:sensor histidine kinase [Spirosoma radiotolerans]|uniref:Signal transduction histidine kinase internal region domain-containing protein n=1 Tax=Spirosoma radiotolerans TaxID=1379870 RepID=A0A0E4A2C9_9BACT|nr:sensor histidine kinase [Spirosoma radiotolerans]AKD58808.1 hypothetical protein SD10_26455 [Spirosoma radiotolerans]